MLGNLRNRPLVKTLLGNSAWILADKGLRILVGLWVTGYMARQLGQEQFGQIHWALSAAYLFTIFGNLGLDQVINRDISRHRAQETTILKTAFFLKGLGSVTGFLILALSSWFWVADQLRLSFLLALASLLFMGFEIGEIHFHSLVRSKVVVWIRSGLFILGSSARWFLAAKAFPPEYFLAVATLEVGLGSLILFFAFQAEIQRFWQTKVDFKIAKALLAQSVPMMALGIFAAALIRVDSFFIEKILGVGELGVYSAALRLVEVFYILPMALVGSSLPALSQAYSEDPKTFARRSEELFRSLSLLGWCLALGLYLAAPILIDLIFGSQFTGAISVLKIYCWALPFCFSGAVRTTIWISQGKLLLPNIALGVAVVTLVYTFFDNYFGQKNFTIEDFSFYFVLANTLSYWLLTAPDWTLFRLQTKRLFWPF